MANDISRVNIIENVGRKLQAQFGDNPIPVNEIVKEARKISNCRYAKSSIMPSDFCYNSVNKDPASASMNNPMFRRDARGKYMFLGKNYPYSGEVSWTPKGKETRIIGEWVNGNYLPHDTLT